jgi:hypothetical protein
MAKTAKSNPKAISLNILCHVVQIGGSYIGITTIGGFRIKGARCDDQETALQALFYALAQRSNDDAVMGIQLELEGTTLDDAVLAAMATDEQSFELPNGDDA